MTINKFVCLGMKFKSYLITQKTWANKAFYHSILYISIKTSNNKVQQITVVYYSSTTLEFVFHDKALNDFLFVSNQVTPTVN